MLVEELQSKLKKCLEPAGMEVYFFKVSWYNQQVEPNFHFSFDNDTLCSVILTVPSFFEKAFLPYLKGVEGSKLVCDPVDSCIAHHINEAKNLFPDIKITAMFDYELLPNRRPKVLVQTAAHVAGAAFYYQRKHVQESFMIKTNHQSFSELSASSAVNCPNESSSFNDPWHENQRIYGVSIHPVFGGWFSIRSVLIFHDIFCPDMKYTPPVDSLPSKNARVDLLNKFNNCWQDWTYRDVIPVKEKYSQLQKEYFATLPKDRLKLLSKWTS